ncbi:BrnA antitoxin family protein [Gemmatimonas sp.]|uniref:BrnA antitoxin family protein n=1 Tax=Gemmatimonas sp. TaxID=1962908 RepID=UPI00286DA65B|nr:BrnA antitoxin family protein [Gemmatimonas sp.]
MPKASKPSAPKTTARKRTASTLAPMQGRADLARLRRTSDAEIARTAPAELRDIPDDFWKGARVVTPVSKEAISIRLDHDVIAWFRSSGPRYQSRINAVLRSYVEQVEATSRTARSKRAP